MRQSLFGRQLLFVSLVMLLLVTCFSCKKDKNEVDRQYDRPTWAVADTTNLEYSMTVTGSLPESFYATADTLDLVAAFCNDQCCGVTSVEWIDEERPMYFLYIVKPSQSQLQFEVTLRYYSAVTRHIFVEKKAFSYTPDTTMGTIDAPYVPAFAEQE